jgi:ER-bound oxygenase mpaB/B'/Rubber oxygenase, catalytic domain
MGAWRVVETLARTGGFGMNVTRRRLLETFQHFLDVTADLPAVQPGGKGHISSVRVRLLHAAVRRRLMNLDSQRPGYFDQAHWGIPINDLHQIGTISAYSANLIWEALPRQGIYLTDRQIADYLALWRWIGYIMGTPVDWMDTPSRAKAMAESAMVSEIEPSRNSQILANNILTAESNVPPLYARREYLAALTHRLNGDDLSTALAVERPSVYWRALVWMQCRLLYCMGYVYPWMSDAQRERRRKVGVPFQRPYSTTSGPTTPFGCPLTTRTCRTS